jgi:neopullulanase
MFKLTKIITIRFALIASILFTVAIRAQDFSINTIEPPNWWSGMKYNHLQLMVYGKNLSKIKAFTNSSLLQIDNVQSSENGDYSFVELIINENIIPGKYQLYFTNLSDTVSYTFPIFEREKNSNSFKGFNSSDIVYLITPDRFANGDTANDDNPELIDRYNPSSPVGRHGGDIQGIIDKLDYLKDLGITVIWITPLLENNMKLSYHGYAATDLYKVDSRFGDNELYKKLVTEAHNKSLKIIYDHVNNHIGSNHIWVADPPFKDWFNESVENHFRTPHQKISIYDINSPESVADSTMNGWFVDAMPDLNQKNPFVAKYLIQNTLWWIEYSGIDGIREDTYPYSDQKYLSDWARTIIEEYPYFNIVGEVWNSDAAFLAPYQGKSKLHPKFDTNLPSVTDFGFFHAVQQVFDDNQPIKNIYESLAKDYLYSDPMDLLIFLDNHDVERIMYRLKGNVKRFKLAMTLLLTMRGIPQIYYGTEIGLEGGKGDGNLRADFPGGFPGNTENAFTNAGSTMEENGIFSFVQNLIKIRKEHKSLSIGKFFHFPPVGEVYFYFREYENEKIFVVLNNSNSEQKIDLSSLNRFTSPLKYLLNLETGEKVDIQQNKEIKTNAGTGYIYLLTN